MDAISTTIIYNKKNLFEGKSMNEPKNQKRQFSVILLIVFLSFLGISMPYLIFPPLILNPEFSILPVSWGIERRALFLGILLAAYPLGQFIGSPILGSLSDEHGRKKLLSASLLISGICNLLTAAAISWQILTVLVLSRFLNGFMEGNIAIARAMASDLKSLSKHKTFGRINAATSIAYLIGPVTGGILTDKNLFEGLTISTPFYLTCFLFLFLSGLSILILTDSERIKPSEIRSFWQRINFLKRISILFKNKQLKWLILSSTFFTLAVDIFYEFSPVYLTMRWTLAPAQMVFYNAALCVGLAVGNGWLPGFFSSSKSNRLPITIAMGGFTLLLLGIVWSNTPLVIILLFAIIGLAIGLAVTLITTKISDTASHSIQGEVMGVQVSLRVLGDGVICLFGAVLLILSSKIILIAAAFMSLATMFYYRSRKLQEIS